MPERIPQSVTIRVPLLAYLTGTSTVATGKTIAVTISKNGAAFANPSGGATNATEIANGAYYVDLSTTDTGTTGPLVVLGTAGTIDNVFAVYDVANAHNAGFDALPNTACTTNASLLTSGTGADQLSVSSGQTLVQSGTGTGQLSVTAGVVKANTTQFAGQTITCAAGVTVLASVGTAATDTAQTGDSFARIGPTGSGLTSLAPSSTALSTAQWTNTLATNLGTLAGHDPGATLASQTNITGGTIATVTNLTNLPSIPANWLTAAGVAASALNGKGDWLLASSYTAAPTAASNASTLLATAVATGNTANTVGDCLNAARAQGFGKWVLAGTTLTLYAADGTTAVRTFTLDSGTAPTQRV